MVGKGWAAFDLIEARKELSFKVEQLEHGDRLLVLENGELQEHKVIELRNTNESVEMYNVEYVAKNHTFFANGILVHNKN